MFSKVNELVAKYATKVSDHNKKRKEKIKMSLTEELWYLKFILFIFHSSKIHNFNFITICPF